MNTNLNKVVTFVKRYKYIIATLLFAVLIMFSKQANVFLYYNLYKQKKELQIKKGFYIKEIRNDSINTAIIQKDINAAEKFAREKYLFKRDSEDIFIIRKAEDTSFHHTIN